MSVRGIVAGAFLVVHASLSGGAEVAVLPVNVTNLKESEGTAVGMVMARQYEAVSGKSTLGPSETQPVYEEHQKSRTATAEALGVSQYIAMSAIALERKILVEAVLHEKDGAQLFRAQMTAVSLDDMTDVCERLARALVSRVPPAKTIQLENVTEIETEETNRLFAERISGLKTAIVHAEASRDFEPMAVFGYNMKLEAKKFFLEFGAAAMLPSDFGIFGDTRAYGGVHLEMGGSYYLNDHPWASPYFGAGISPRFLFEPGNVGVAPYLQAGVMFMRVSSMRLFADIRVAQNALPLEFYEYEYDYDLGYEEREKKEELYPTEIGFEIGIGW